MIRVLFLSLLLSLPAAAGEVLSEPPAEVGEGERYLFYMHGQIVENEGPRPTHPRWGLYDYPAVIQALAVDGITVISELREKGTDHAEYAQKIHNQAQSLLQDGVPASHITVAGFSAGGMIATRVSDIAESENINFIIMASCSGWLEDEPDLSLSGRVLSVYEKSDGPQSCQFLADRPPGPDSFYEIEINTGLEHGAFYLPREAWVSPLLDWVRSH